MSRRLATQIGRGVAVKFAKLIAKSHDLPVERTSEPDTAYADAITVYAATTGDVFAVVDCDLSQLLHIAVESSGLSSSAYVTITDSRAKTWRVRVSDHDSRPTYERQRPSDYHVGVYQDADTHNWRDAIDWAISVLTTGDCRD